MVIKNSENSLYLLSVYFLNIKCKRVGCISPVLQQRKGEENTETDIIVQPVL